MKAEYRVEQVARVANEIGEAPIWLPEESRIYWVDAEGSRAFSLRPTDGELRSYNLSMPATALLRRRGGGWVAVTKRGLAFWDQSSGAFEFMVDPVANPVANRDELCFNDGAIDRRGALVAGTMNFREHIRKDGGIFRLAPDLRFHELDSGLSVANGIGFSLDGSTLYVSEQFAGRILAWDYDQDSGSVSRRRTFAEVDRARGLPDGIIVDAEGYIWNGRWGGACIARYAPDGSLDREIPMPVETSTCLAFGGESLDELYVTTAWYGLDAAGRRASPGAGKLFRIRTGIRGLVEPRFAS
jgi:sugar lactone lactonase YvrE